MVVYDWKELESNGDTFTLDHIPVISRKNIPMRIKYLPGATKMVQEEHGGCIDCYTYEDVFMRAGEHKLISLGFSAELPEGYDALLFARSSTFKNYGLKLANSVGYIDYEYNGDNDIWMASVKAERDIHIPKDSRICQFRLIERMPLIDFEEVDTLGNDNRSGFGSTGL